MIEPQVGEIFTIGLDTWEVGGKIAGFLADGIVVDFSDRALAFLAEQGLVFKAGYLTEARRMGNPCWKGYRALGLKKKNGKQVPNCIPVTEGQLLIELGITTDREYAIFVNGKPATKYQNKNEALETLKIMRHRRPDAAFQLKQKVCHWEPMNDTMEDAAGVGVVKNSRDPRYMTATMGDQNDVTGDTLNQELRAFKLAEAEYHGKKVPLGKKLPGDVKKFRVYVRKPNGNIVKVNFGDKTMRIKKSNPKRRKSFRARHHCESPGPRWKARYWSCRNW